METTRRPPVLIALAFVMVVAGDGVPLTEMLRGSLPLAVATAQQADRVVPPAALTGKMASVDEAFALFVASSSLAQIEGARLVMKSTRNGNVVDFAQRIVRDHSDALDRLRRIAAQRGLELPAAATGRHADLVTKLAGVAPSERDDAFIQRFGLDAHKEAIALTERHVKEGKDAELKRYAEQVLETLREHMAAARKIAYAESAR
jgi:putative membrane protein